MKKFERRYDSKLHPFIGFLWLLTAIKIINQQNLDHQFFPIFRVSSLPEKISTTIFFNGKPNASSRFLAQVLKKVFWGLLSNFSIQWIKLTKRPYNHTKFFVLVNFSGFRKWQNSSSGSDETKIFIYKVPFTVHPLVELIHNSTNPKCLQKEGRS